MSSTPAWKAANSPFPPPGVLALVLAIAPDVSIVSTCTLSAKGHAHAAHDLGGEVLGALELPAAFIARVELANESSTPPGCALEDTRAASASACGGGNDVGDELELLELEDKTGCAFSAASPTALSFASQEPESVRGAGTGAGAGAGEGE